MTLRRIWLAGVVGFFSLQAKAELNAKVTCAQNAGASKDYLVVVQDLNAVTIDPSGGIVVRGKGLGFDKHLRAELKNCRSYYWKAQWGYDSDGNSIVNTIRIPRNWNVVTMKSGGPMILSCAPGSALSVIETAEEWKLAVARSVIGMPPIALNPPMSSGEETISEPACLVD